MHRYVVTACPIHIQTPQVWLFYRNFTEFGVKRMGWVGSLAWLQHQNMLYGTELAEQADVDL